MDEIPSSLAVDNNETSTESSQGPLLDRRIINVVKSAPDHTVRPARLAAELGISVNDACAELCGLLASVGGGLNGASFRFEKMSGQDVMVFYFPPDFEERALRKRRYDDLWTACRNAMTVGIRALKIVTAFGLILSLLILCVAAVIGLLAAVVAISREGNRGGGHRAILMRQIRSLFFTIRQLLWFYAAFGPDSEGQHPFLREIAYDCSLVLSCCCGNPGSLFYWLRAAQLSRRRNRIVRGWRSGVMESEIEGVSLVRRGTWGEENSDMASSVSEDGYKGLLSVAVEFLFGPTPSSASTCNVWKLRAAVIVNYSSIYSDTGVPLEVFAPYLSFPPKETGSDAIVEQGLLIVAHFNGVPKNGTSVENMTKAEFLFPELIAESEVSLQYEHSVDNDNGTWEEILYSREGHNSTTSKSNELPEYFEEGRYKFTRLTPQQLCHCLSLGVLNLIGVLWLGQSVSKGGVLELDKNSILAKFLTGVLLPVLRAYGVLFLALPAARLLILSLINSRLSERNKRRQRLAKMLTSP